MRMSKPIFRGIWRAGMLAAWLAGSAAHADLGILLEVEHTTFLRLETVLVFVTVTNRSPDVLVLDQKESPGRARLDFDVRRIGQGAVKRIRRSPLERPLELQPGEGRRLLVELDHAFDMSATGDYIIEAYVIREDLRYGTKPRSISVVRGIPLDSVSQSVPGQPGLVRNMSLSYLAREQHETLFLSVDEPRSGLNYGVFALGPLVRIFRPVLESPGDGRIVVVHQSGPRQYMRSILQSTPGSVRMVDQSYESVKGHISTSGDWVEPMAKPTPAPVKDRQPASNR